MSWQSEVIAIAAELVRMKWDERIPDDFAEEMTLKALRLRDIVRTDRAVQNIA